MVFVYLAYCKFGYQTYKSISSPAHEIDSPAGLKRRKLLLKWVCSSIIIWLVNISDYTLGFIPTYYFWRGILFPLMIFDGDLATKILMVFEKHIEGVEKWVDKVVSTVCSIYNLVYFPTFIFLIQKFDFVVNGASPSQLEVIEKLIKTFRLNVKKALNVLEPKKVENVTKEVITSKKRVVKTPTRSSTQAIWNAEVKVLITSNLGKKTFYPYTISYDIKSKKINFQAAKDDVIISDTLVGVRVRDNSKHILEIQLEGGNKTVSFTNSDQLDMWAKFLETQC